jgi:hypothetical protein
MRLSSSFLIRLTSLLGFPEDAALEPPGDTASPNLSLMGPPPPNPRESPSCAVVQSQGTETREFSFAGHLFRPPAGIPEPSFPRPSSTGEPSKSCSSFQTPTPPPRCESPAIAYATGYL